MRYKKQIVAFVMFGVLLMINGNLALAAPQNFDKLNPNTYEKQEFNENTDFLHEESLYENKEAIPEEQLVLTFEQQEASSLDHVKARLFADMEKKNNTIVIKAQQMQLFSNTGEENLQLAEYSETVANQNGKLMIVYICLVVIAIFIILVLLIPKMVQGMQESKE
ncbi:type VII secretion protein EssA [Bacillaceae bacterium Marseille-Q3522]|nr:type VII secretion protein EssA [Bacillaceae bacterium Marseille-Q3522]